MIVSFADKRTERLHRLDRVREYQAFERAALRKLAMLAAAVTIEDLLVPPGNRLEVLRGERAVQWPLRINDQWRLCFRWEGGDAHDVEICDYH